MNEQKNRWLSFLPSIGLVLLALALIARWQSFGPDAVAYASAGLGIAVFLLYVALNWHAVLAAFSARQVRYGSNALLLVVAVLAILVLINFLANRHDKTFDLTANKQYTLSDETVKILKGLKEPVKVVAFFLPNDSRQDDARQMLQRYASHSKYFSYEIVDAEKDRAKVLQYKITSPGVLVFVRGKRRQETYGTDEQSLTSTLLKVIRNKPKIVYFITGHGEHNPDQYTNVGYSSIKTAMNNDFFKVKELDLATITTTVPSDANVLVLAAPQKPLAKKEVKILFDYLNKGGKLMILSDNGLNFSEMKTELTAWGIYPRADLVIDPRDSFFGDPTTPLISQYHYSAVTKNMEGVRTIFPGADSLEIVSPAPKDKTVISLFETSTSSWGETNWKNASSVHYDAGKDIKGPLTLAATATAMGGKSRLVIFGDSDFVSNGLLNRVQGTGNATLFMNALNWLAEDEELISIPPKPPASHPLKPLTAGQRSLIYYVTVVFLPLLILIVGLYVWWERR